MIAFVQLHILSRRVYRYVKFVYVVTFLPIGARICQSEGRRTLCTQQGTPHSQFYALHQNDMLLSWQTVKFV